MSQGITPAGSPGAMPGGAAQPGQPPIGSSPATTATSNPGLQAKGVQAAGALLNAMAMLVPLVGAQTPLGQAIVKSMGDIGKHIPPGAVTPQSENNFLRQMALRQQQMAPHRAAVGAAMPGGAPGPMTPAPAA